MLVLQDPTNDKSTTLLESVSEALDAAQSLSGMFAFVSKSGVELLSGEANFRKVAENGEIDLIIGIDAVTNEKAIDALVKLNRQFPRIKLRAFMNPKPSGLFHPKFAFMRGEKGGFQITGSGNLTEGGLIANWEAYSFEKLNNCSLTETETTFDNWTTLHATSLIPITDPKVRERASKNTHLAVIGDLPILSAGRSDNKESDTELLVTDNMPVLIAEIPKWKNRPKQANFHKKDFMEYFGANLVSNPGRLWSFRHVNADGTMTEYEPPRPPVKAKSSNYRFELKMASGPYPEARNELPIGVFVRMATRSYFYRMLFKVDPDYEIVRKILVTRKDPKASAIKMLTTRMKVGELKTLWPDSPFWNLPSLD